MSTTIFTPSGGDGEWGGRQPDKKEEEEEEGLYIIIDRWLDKHTHTIPVHI